MQKIRVVELFAGVGGFRLGLEGYRSDSDGIFKSASSQYTEPIDSNYEVIWSNQWEPSSKRPGHLQEANLVYSNRWKDSETSIHYPKDIDSVASPEFDNDRVDNKIPDHDLLVGGFPCQDYSVAGVNTKGLDGKKGVLWWNIHKILEAKRPKYIFLENVDRLLKSPTNQRGRDFAVMLTTLNNLGYSVEWKVINAADYGMPQRRRRVYILAYYESCDINIKKDGLKSWCLETGILQTAFPSIQFGAWNQYKLDTDPSDITKHFSEGKFLNSGIMVKSEVWMTDFKPVELSPAQKASYSKSHNYLKDVLVTDTRLISPEFYVHEDKQLKKPLERIQQTGFEVDESLERQGDVIILKNELDKWKYLKGRKAEQRISSKGTFYYKEGPLKLYDDIHKPSRTIITSEGGPGASRFKHLININGVSRRLIPMELERLNMFPDDHTKLGWDGEKDVKISDSKRAFFMGNALVVGVIEKIGQELANRILAMERASEPEASAQQS